MSKSLEVDAYLKHVVTTIGRQLKDWDEGYAVRLLHDLLDERSFYVVVHLADKTYQVNLELSHVATLQDHSPYTLDRHIWEALINQGLVIEKTQGDYLDKCHISR